LTDSVDHVCTNKELFSESSQLKLGNISGISHPAVTSPSSVALGLKGNGRCYVCDSYCKQRIASK